MNKYTDEQDFILSDILEFQVWEGRMYCTDK